ncbi:MAG: hypothetical protein IKC19_07075 [Bacteroidales bacterium]|nr:hypothetical protein [Bacteroidales bacterium]
MNKKSKTVAIFAMLSMVAVGCHKESEMELCPVSSIGMQGDVVLLSYSVDGTNCVTAIYGSSAYRDFIYQLLALAEQGHEVSFAFVSETGQAVVKDVVTYSTTDKDAAFAWADKMIADGYSVTVSYDAVNGVYNCLARK